MNGEEGQVQEVKQKKEKEKPGSKWVIVLILAATLIASLVFGWNESWRPFGPAVYRFGK